MSETVLEKLKAWLFTCPYWEDFQLLPKGVEETNRLTDLMGNSLIGCRYVIDLYWQMPAQGNETENVCRLLDFLHWVQEQDVLCYTPQLGDVRPLERIRAEKSGFTPGARFVTYTVTLVADFAKSYAEDGR